MPKILVVDDDSQIILLLKSLLSSSFEVLTASSAADAVGVYKQHHAALKLVLLDVQMPDEDGPATLTAMRQIDSTVPVFFMSGHTGEYSEKELLELGAARIIPKPFLSLRELSAVIREAAN